MLFYFKIKVLFHILGDKILIALYASVYRIGHRLTGEWYCQDQDPKVLVFETARYEGKMNRP